MDVLFSMSACDIDRLLPAFIPPSQQGKLGKEMDKLI